MTRLPPRIALAVAAALVAVCLVAPVPVLDEESYLDLARQLDPARPYDWWRAWQPWGSSRAGDAYVYAHPPLFLLWVKAWMWGGGAGLPVRALKAAAALPWAMLMGWSAGRLAERVCRRPWMAAGAWLAAPITVLGLQRGLMPDLMVTALATFSVVSWIEGQAQSGGVRLRWLAFAGVAAGLAGFTKYPALVVLLPLVVHGWRTGRMRGTWPCWLTFALVWGGGEAWLWAGYGRPHLLEVLTRAGEIGRGDGLGRALGVLARLGLAGCTVFPLVLWPWRRALLPSLATGAVLALVGAPAGTPPTQALLVATMAAAGVLALSVAGRPLVPGQAVSRDDRTPGDGLLLGTWAIVAMVAVALAHNYAAPRYLLPAVLPITLLVARAAERRLEGRVLFGVGTALTGALALALTVAEHRFADAQVAAADAAIDAVEASGDQTPGWFSGEWAFRWRMEQRGWTWWGGTPLPPGETLIAATEAGPRAIPSTWIEGAHHARGRAPLRVVHAAAGVALYGETIGVQPIGRGVGLLEEAVTWTTR